MFYPVLIDNAFSWLSCVQSRFVVLIWTHFRKNDKKDCCDEGYYVDDYHIALLGDKKLILRYVERKTVSEEISYLTLGRFYSLCASISHLYNRDNRVLKSF